MKTKLTFFIFLLVSSFHAGAQGEADNWYFGTGAYLDFSGTSPVAGTGPLSTSEGVTSVSDAAGNVLFYSNGVDVWDGAGNVMANGSGLMGDISSTQSALAVPSPVLATQFYLFTTAADGSANGFRYSIIDMTLNGGLGDVDAVNKNIVITDSTTEKIAAIRDDLGTGYWIVVHKWGCNHFYAYHLTVAGLAAPIISYVGTVHSTSAIQNTYGQMKFNMCGNKLALAIGYQDLIELFDFDKSTGVVSNAQSIPMGGHVYGIEFSKSSSLLYATCYDASSKLAQFDLTQTSLSAIIASKTTLSLTDDLYSLQMGPNGRIYVSRSFGTSYLGAIGSPETVGTGCNYVDNAIDLDPSFMGVNGALGLPSFLQDYLNTDVSCPPVINAISETDGNTKNLIFPNPSDDEFQVDLSGNSPLQITVYDYSGKLIETRNVTGTRCLFGKTYSNGIYWVQVKTEQGQQSYKVIKQ